MEEQARVLSWCAHGLAVCVQVLGLNAGRGWSSFGIIRNDAHDSNTPAQLFHRAALDDTFHL